MENQTHQELRNTIASLECEQRFKREIINTLQDGIIVFSPELALLIINQEALRLLDLTADESFDLEAYPFFKNRKATISFKFNRWIQKLLSNPDSNVLEQHIWFKPNTTKKAKHYLFSAKTICNDQLQVESILLVIYDLSAQTISDEKERLLDAAFNSFDGQFFTNEKGYITKPNAAFSAYTGLMSKELSELNIIQWLKKQVTMKAEVEEVLRTLLEDGKWSGEIQVHPDEETTFYSVLSLNMVTDTEGNIETYVGTLQDITDIKEAQAEVEHLAFYDDLTDLANRRFIIELIEKSILHTNRYNTFNSLFYVDLDRFKAVNDMFGHAIGDKLLQQISMALKKTLRKDDYIARIASDEFIILTNANTDTKSLAVSHAHTLGNKIIETINQELNIEQHRIHPNASVGICIFPIGHGDSPENLISCADLAMFEAKRHGRNQIRFYQESLTEELRKKHALEQALTHSDLETEFELYYQPQMNQSGELTSAEALIRWNSPELGCISPGLFIPIAEESRQILRIGKWVIETAFQQAKKWHEQYDLKNVSINISPIQFHEDDFVVTVLTLQKKTQVDPSRITLELTEGVLISNIEEAFEKMEILNDAGFHFSIDDFGTGYSSLSYFQRMNIKELKIDQSFVFKAPQNKEDVAIIKTIVQLAQSKNLKIVAEGVENIEQVDFLKACDPSILLQGYYFHKPITLPEFSTLLEQQH